MQANKLSYYCFIDAGRSYKSPGSETKDFMTPGESQNLCVGLCESSIASGPMEVTEGS